MVKEIALIPVMDASYFPIEVDTELEDHEVWTHDNTNILRISWDRESFPEFKKWLVATYGMQIREYTSFAIQPT